jgi:hypothetical protein
MALIPGTRPLLWTNFFGKIYLAGGVYLLFDATVRSPLSLFGGGQASFPRRPAGLALHDAVYSLLFLYTSPFLAATRLLKSILTTVVGMLVVTRPGTHEGVLFGDICHCYYMSILRVERFRLEVEKWGMRNEKLTCRSYCVDSLWYVSNMLLVWAFAISVYCLLAYLCGVELAEAFSAAQHAFSPYL